MKAVLVFCEGRHDIVFAQRSLGARAGCRWVDRPIGNLPSPFGRSAVARKGLIARRLEEHALEDLSLRDAAFQPLPCFESIIENTATDTIFFMVRALGKDQSGPVLDLLRLLDVTIAEEPVGTFDVSEYAVAFLFDANSEGVAATLAAFRNRYGEHFGDLGNLEHGNWVTETTVPVGCFVFHRNAQDQNGTLEDHVAPMVEEAWPARYAAARRFVDDNRSTGDRVSSRDADRLKAIITATGQFDHPGAPMSIIIGRGALPRARFDVSPLSADLADFLAGTPWNNP